MQKVFNLLQLKNVIYLICTGTGSRAMLLSCKGNVWKCLSIKNGSYFFLLSLALENTQWVLTLQVVLELLGFLERELKHVTPSLKRIENCTRVSYSPRFPMDMKTKEGQQQLKSQTSALASNAYWGVHTCSRDYTQKADSPQRQGFRP